MLGAWMDLQIIYNRCSIIVPSMELEYFLMSIVKKIHKMDLIMVGELGK
jgi:hypothetical protein